VVASCAGAPTRDLFDEPVARVGAVDAAQPGAGASEAGVPSVVEAGATVPATGDASSVRADAADTSLADAATAPGADATVRPADAASAPGSSADAGLADASLSSVDAAVAPSYTADACLTTPSAYTASCDPACRPINCRLIDCPMAPVITWGLNEQTMLAMPWRLRTARATTEPACSTRCGAATVAKGVVRFELDFPTPTNVTIKVGAPWRIVVNPRYALCVSQAEADSSTASCVSREFTKATVTVFTTDRAAPPRDIVIDHFPRTYCTGTP
jgi:hypothetical protein